MKQIVQKILPYLKKLTCTLEKKYVSNDTSGKKAFASLAPKIIKEGPELKKIEPYIENLEKAINTEGINNIAITGSYGSGKSTILKTFQYHHQNIKFLNISLASFKDNKEDKEEDFDRKLEISILQQIFYHVKPSEIPDSRFKRITNLTNVNLIIQAGFFILWTISALFLFKFNYINKLDPNTWSARLKLDWLAFFVFIVFLTGLGLFAKAIVRLFSNSKINKLSIKGEVELGDVKDKSVFNQHLDEILYYFEKTKFDVVIIEDVDRFNSTDIFTKLREINILINNSDLIKRKVTFVYAVKDEMFKESVERVKFFEFIIPVIPFINPSNANEQLKKMIALAGIENVLSADFTDDVITFIDEIDMRLLINIFQEFLLYKETLSKDLDPNELFAIILYKNMFPEDFALLSKRGGDLYKFILDKAIYIQTFIDKLKAQIDQLEIENKNMEKETMRSIRNLRAEYVGELVSSLTRPYTINNLEVTQLIEETNFKNLLDFKGNIPYQTITFRQNYGNYIVTNADSGIKFSDIEKKVNAKNGFLGREKLVTDNNNGKLESNKIEIERLRNRITEIESWSLKEIFEKVSIDKFLGRFKDDYLIRNLLVNGYINENYNDYISIFHEVNLSQDDFTFERKVKSGISSPFDSRLTHTENLIKKLAVKYFNREVILNLDLVDKLILCKDKYPQKISCLLELLNSNSENIFQFILEFIGKKYESLSIFINLLVKYNHDFCTYIIQKSNLPDERIRELIRLIFEHAALPDINRVSEPNILSNYISRIQNICNYCSQFNATKNLMSFIKEQKIVFVELDEPDERSKPIFTDLVENNSYLITIHNLKIICKQFDSSFDESGFNTSNYSYLKKINYPYLLNYVQNNIGDYVEKILLQSSENKNEDENAIVGLLNNPALPIESKTSFLSMQIRRITSFGSIGDVEIRELVLNCNKIKPTWENIFAYIDAQEKKSIDQTLINYLNHRENYTQLSLNKLDTVKEKDEEYIKDFSSQLIYCSGLEFDAYINLLKAIPYQYLSLDFSGIDDQRVNWMLDNKFVLVTPKNFANLKQSLPGLQIKLLATNESKFFENFADYPLEPNDWVSLFGSGSFSGDGKLQLISKIDDSLIISDPDIANTIAPLLSEDNNIPIRIEVLLAIFEANKSLQTRIDLLKLQEKNVNNDQMTMLTEKLGEDYWALFKEDEKRSFVYQQYNIDLFKMLKKRNLISEFKATADKDEIKVTPKKVE
ncbi:MAG TPA: hypothetical protein VK787_14485 [Puia sp.]|nr:hypothetical protein [Puia sp.]